MAAENANGCDTSQIEEGRSALSTIEQTDRPQVFVGSTETPHADPIIMVSPEREEDCCMSCCGTCCSSSNCNDETSCCDSKCMACCRDFFECLQCEFQCAAIFVNK